MTFGQDEYATIARIHQEGEVLEQLYDDNAVTLRFRMKKADAERMDKQREEKGAGGNPRQKAPSRAKKGRARS